MDWIIDVVDYGVLGILFVLCFFVVAFGIERTLFLNSVQFTKYICREQLEYDLRKRLSFIGTVAMNTPYIGLLGTVLGIMLTFYKIGLNSAIATDSIMLGLALSLKATAGGLIVAIISVLFYNRLTVRAQGLLLQWDIAEKINERAEQNAPSHREGAGQ
jgi:biopolymer transport protein ExbB